MKSKWNIKTITSQPCQGSNSTKRFALVTSQLKYFDREFQSLNNLAPFTICTKQISNSMICTRAHLPKCSCRLDAAVWIFRSGQCQRRDRKFPIYLRKCNCPLRKMQTAASSLNEPKLLVEINNVSV